MTRKKSKSKSKQDKSQPSGEEAKLDQETVVAATTSVAAPAGPSTPSATAASDDGFPSLAVASQAASKSTSKGKSKSKSKKTAASQSSTAVIETVKEAPKSDESDGAIPEGSGKKATPSPSASATAASDDGFPSLAEASQTTSKSTSKGKSKSKSKKTAASQSTTAVVETVKEAPKSDESDGGIPEGSGKKATRAVQSKSSLRMPKKVAQEAAASCVSEVTEGVSQVAIEDFPSLDAAKTVSTKPKVVAKQPEKGEATATSGEAGTSAEASKSQKEKKDDGKSAPVLKDLESEIEKQLKLHGVKSNLCSRPAVGRAGRAVPLIVNYFKLQVKPFVYHQYDVVVSSLSTKVGGDSLQKETEKRKKIKAMDLNQKVFKRLADTNEKFRGIFPVFDGQKNLYTSQELNISGEWSAIVVLNEDGRDERFDVRIKYAASIVYNPARNQIPTEQGIAALEIMFRYGPRFAQDPKICLRALIFGQEYLQNPRQQLQNNKWLAYGYYSNVRATRSGLAVNIDRAATVFNGGGPLLDAISRIITVRPPFILNDGQRDQIEENFKGLKFVVLHLAYRRKYVFHCLTAKSVSEVTFTEDGKSISVKDYFEKKYADFFRDPKKRLRPKLPCVKTVNGKYLPIEVCYLLPHQQFRGKRLPEDIISEMTRQSASMRPEQRFQNIQASRDSLCADGANYLTKFGVQVDAKPMQIMGRLLPPPRLQNKNSRNQVVQFSPRSVGSWKMQPQQHFFVAVPLQCWLIVNFSQLPMQIKPFFDKLKEIAARFGVQVAMPAKRPEFLKYTGPTGLRGRISEAIFEPNVRLFPKLQLIMFILPKQADGIYEEIKHAGDVLHGVATQCIAEERFFPSKKGHREFPPLACNDDYLFNLLQKINTRLGGINTCLDPQSKPPVLRTSVMVVGIDASHPSPGDKVSRSVAACVASMDSNYAKYNVTVKAQEPFVNVRMDDEDKSKLVEEIVKLDEMMYTLLVKYREHNNKLPDKIMIFRDGVSDGQFMHVFRHEIVALKNSFTKFGNYKPQLTLVVVQKRHHTRFMPDFQRGGTTELRSGNVMPGTCVDDYITSPILFDYYLCSHEGALGTSRPARYCVLYDDSSMDADTLQQITYYLCYIYGRCLKPISIPAPVGYAHLASKKAREHLKSQQFAAGPGGNLLSMQEAIDTRVSMPRNNSYFI